MLNHSPADQLLVPLDGSAVPGQKRSERHRRGLAQALQIREPRERADLLLARSGIDLGVRADPGQHVVAHESDSLVVVDEQRVGGAVAWADYDAEVAPAGMDQVTLEQAHVRGERLAVVADVVPEAFVVGDHLIGDAMRRHQRAREAAFSGGPLLVLLRVVGQCIEHRHPGARAALNRRHQADVVEVVMGRDRQLDVLDTDTVLAQPALQGGERLVVTRPGVDQRQRVAAQEPCVDRANIA